MNNSESRSERLKKQIISAYSEEKAQEKYLGKAENGLWDSERYFIDKYWKNKEGKVLDLGCGTGRTTLGIHSLGYRVTGIDLVPKMIENAQKIAAKNKAFIDYRVGDVTRLETESNSFDYVFFSNLGWPQIPSADERFAALQEMYRVLKPGGVLILVTARRVWLSSYFTFWVRQWIKFYLLRPIGFKFKEEVFGDRFYDRETKDRVQVYSREQYVYIPSVSEVVQQLNDVGFTLLEANGTLQISQSDIRKLPPMFYIAKKHE